MSGKAYDVVVIGAGSIGLPTSLALAEKGLSVLCLDEKGAPGQGSQKCAIGGIRATHSDPSKVAICLDSLETFRTWKERYGDDIGWSQGGYTYVAYDTETEALLQGILPSQKATGLKIDWLGPAAIGELIPGIRLDGLFGGTHSPEDGNASPLGSAYAFHKQAMLAGVCFAFGEKVRDFEIENGHIVAVKSQKARFTCGSVINCAGMAGQRVAALVGVNTPVRNDLHEAGITEPVEPFFRTMVVDIRKVPGSSNYYFYQNEEGQVIFCITPDPQIWGEDLRETSEFLPMVATRMVDLYPRLSNLKVRRTWRGCYPNSPDGSPFLDQAGPANHYVAVGMSGQGFMLGPGIGKLLARMLTGETTDKDLAVLRPLRVDRAYASQEALT